MSYNFSFKYLFAYLCSVFKSNLIHFYSKTNKLGNKHVINKIKNIHY
ncbi:MAG: hypothetical protein H6Q20_36 [Bacteroidetes bacterium]|jgi:hypothetical protein|nr:hypothetical protein [Bacteroidota bacterium]